MVAATPGNQGEALFISTRVGLFSYMSSLMAIQAEYVDYIHGLYSSLATERM